MGGDGRMGDAGGRGPHQHFGIGIVGLNQTLQPLFHVGADVRRRQGQPVVTVNRTLNAAGLIGPEKHGSDAQQILCNARFQHKLSSCFYYTEWAFFVKWRNPQRTA